MKRILAALAVTPLALMALAGPATAAKPQVTRTSERVVYALAGSEFEMGQLFVNAALTQSGPRLWMSYGTADGNGGAVETTVETSTGFTFTPGKGRLRSAKLVAENLPATTCTYQEDQQVGCVDASVDISLTWTGEGRIIRGGSSSRQMGDGFKMITHGTGSLRSADVSGSITVDGTRLRPFDFAELGAYHNFEMLHCTGDACEQPQ